MKKIFIILFPILLSSCSIYTEMPKHERELSQWKLVYYNSDEGACLKGNLSHLIDAVENGKQVRVVMEQGDIICAVDANYLWVKDNIVYAQNNGQVSSHFEGNMLVFQDDSYYWMFIVSSNGDRQAIRWLVGDHNSLGKNNDRISIKWYVKS